MTRGEGAPAARLAEQEVLREARRLLPKLVKDAGHIAPLEDGPGFGLFTRRNAYRRAVQKLPAAMVEAFRRRGWLEGGDGRLHLSEAAEAWLRRAAAGPDAYRKQHQARAQSLKDVGGGARRPVLVNADESPLAWLRRRKDKTGVPLISDDQFQAGERLRSDFWRAHLTPRVTSGWGLPAPSKRTRRGAPDDAAAHCDHVLAAKTRVLDALSAVGPELAGVLVDVCCHLQGIEQAEKTQGWPRRSGKVILQIALTRLARHYGLVRDGDVAASVQRRLRHWGSEDYRPSLDAWR